MFEPPNSMFLTRRGMFALLAGLAGRAQLSAAVVDFWNKKAPAEWSAEEIDRLITKSPWAKEVNAQYVSGGNERNRGGGIGIAGIGNIGRDGHGRGGPSGYQGTVRWESAAPIAAALKAPLPGGFEGRYVISVNGFPATEGQSRSREEEFENLKSLSSLQAKGRELVQAGVVQQQVATTGASFLFGFSRELLPLDADDKEVLFSTQLGKLVVKARFLPKEMLYHGQLAL